MEITSQSEEETAKVARDFANILSDHEVILFYGDLGMGKSVFCRNLIQALCKNNSLEVPSPTFTLVQQYQCDKGIIWHFDLYRLSDPTEIYEIGWEEALGNGITLIEWPERLGALTPEKHIKVVLSSSNNKNPDTRKIEITRYE